MNDEKVKILLTYKIGGADFGSLDIFVDIPFDKNTLLGKKDFGTTVWASCDSILGCSYVDDRLVEFVTDLMRIAEYSKNEKLVILGKIVTLVMPMGCRCRKECKIILCLESNVRDFLLLYGC